MVTPGALTIRVTKTGSSPAQATRAAAKTTIRIARTFTRVALVVTAPFTAGGTFISRRIATASCAGTMKAIETGKDILAAGALIPGREAAKTALGDAAIGNGRGIIVSVAEEDFGGSAPFF